MTPDRRKVLAERLFYEVLQTIENKQKDYASTADALANFKRNADRLGMTPFQIWEGYFNKHVDSINNAIAKNPKDPQCITEPIRGRVIDCIAYLHILDCLVSEVSVVSEEAFRNALRPT